MSAPDRSQEVKQIVLTKATLPFSSDVDRRAFLVEVLVPSLKQLDPQWAYLVKTEQNNKIPADIIVWTPTMEHFDVLTDSGPAWIPAGVITNPAWVPGPIASQPGPTPTPPPATTGGFDAAPILAQLNNIALQNKLTNDLLTALMAELVGRTNMLLEQQDRPLDGSIWGKKFTVTPRQ